MKLRFLFSVVGYFPLWHKLFCTFHASLWYILLLQHLPGFLPSPQHQAELFVVYSLLNGWKMHQTNRNLPRGTSVRTDSRKATASRPLLFQQMRGIVLYQMPWSRPVYVDYSVKMATRETIRPVTQYKRSLQLELLHKPDRWKISERNESYDFTTQLSAVLFSSHKLHNLPRF